MFGCAACAAIEAASTRSKENEQLIDDSIQLKLSALYLCGLTALIIAIM